MAFIETFDRFNFNGGMLLHNSWGDDDEMKDVSPVFSDKQKKKEEKLKKRKETKRSSSNSKKSSFKKTIETVRAKLDMEKINELKKGNEFVVRYTFEPGGKLMVAVGDWENETPDWEIGDTRFPESAEETAWLEPLLDYILGKGWYEDMEHVFIFEGKERGKGIELIAAADKIKKFDY